MNDTEFHQLVDVQMQIIEEMIDDSGEIFVPGDTNTKPSIELVTNLRNQANADGEYQVVRAQNLILELLNNRN